MSSPHRNIRFLPLDDPLFAVKQRKAVPHELVLEAIAALSPQIRPTFGCLAVYVEDKVVLILRDKRDKTADNGVWLATEEEHHESLRREFPNMQSIQILGKKVTGWQSFRSMHQILRSGSARLRARRRQRSSNWQGAGYTAGLEISSKERAEIVEADNQERREESREVVMGS
jgi:hypothetical protein